MEEFKGKGKRQLNARIVHGPLGHTFTVLTFPVKSVPRNEVFTLTCQKFPSLHMAN